MSNAIGPVYARNDYVGFVRRTVALLLDVVILGLFVATSAATWETLAPDEWLDGPQHTFFVILVWLCLMAYLFGFRMTNRGTPGYRIMGICYAPMIDGESHAFSRVYRSAIAVFLLLFFALDHLWILFDPCRQALHDKLSGFYVVKRRAQPIGACRVNRRVINFFMLTFMVYEPVDA